MASTRGGAGQNGRRRGMHALSEIMTAASIVAAIDEGAVWTPGWRRHFLRRVSKEDPTTIAAFRFTKHAKTARVMAERLAYEGDSGGVSEGNAISGYMLGHILRDCEEDNNRHNLLSWDHPTRPHEPNEGERPTEPENVAPKPAVARFGVRIEGLKICGHLNLRGFRMQRPLMLKRCRFNRTLNISSAHTGSFDISECTFAYEDDALASVRLVAGAPRKYFEGRDAYERAAENALPKDYDGAYRILIGVFARGARLSSVRMRGVVADFANFESSTIEGVADLDGACFNLLKAGGWPRTLMEDALSFAGAKVGHISLRLTARVCGTVRLAEAAIGSADFDGAFVAAPMETRGRGHAIYAQNLAVGATLDFGGRKRVGSIDPETGVALQRTTIRGQINIVSARIGGNLRAYALDLDRGLSEDFESKLRAAAKVSAKDRVRDGKKSTSKKFPKNDEESSSAPGDRRPTSRDEREFARAMILRNARIGGSLLLGPKLEDDEEEGNATPFSCKGEIDARGSIIEGDARFIGCTLKNPVHQDKYPESALDLRNCEVKRLLAIVGVGSESKGVIDLTDAKAHSYRDDFDFAAGVNEAKSKKWPKDLKFILLGFEYKSFQFRGDIGSGDADFADKMPLLKGARIRWLMHQPDEWLTRRYQPQPFVQCAQVLRYMGYDAQAHEVLLKREKRAMHSDSVGWLEKGIRQALITACGHGHRMYVLFLWGLTFFLIGLIFNQAAVNANLVRPTSDNILISEDYAKYGDLPTDYSTLAATPFTLKRILPIPPLTGIEWAGCNWRQIRTSLVNPTSGACVPRSCQVAERPHVVKLPIPYAHTDPEARSECLRLPLYVYSTKSFEVEEARKVAIKDCRSGVTSPNDSGKLPSVEKAAYADILCASPNIKHGLQFLNYFSNIGVADYKPLVFFYNIFATLLWLFYNGCVCVAILLGFKLDHTPFVWIDEFDHVVGMNKFLSDGGLTEINMALGFVGWLIWIILATYATGTLKRKE